MAENVPENAHVWLSAKDLARRVGPRRGTRPTSTATVRRWMRDGVCGVVLYSEWDVGSRKTTWEHYLKFKAEVARRHERQRELLRARLKATRKQIVENEKAIKRLEAMGMLRTAKDKEQG